MEARWWLVAGRHGRPTGSRFVARRGRRGALGWKRV